MIWQKGAYTVYGYGPQDQFSYVNAPGSSTVTSDEWLCYIADSRLNVPQTNTNIIKHHSATNFMFTGVYGGKAHSRQLATVCQGLTAGKRGLHM